MQFTKESIIILAMFAALGCGLMGGLFFAFSSFVMAALSHQPAASGVRTMNAINVYILNPLFLSLFLGTALLSAVLGLAAILRLSRPGAALLLAGSALYLVGAAGVTVVFSVPLNNRLSALNPDTIEAAQYWLTYQAEWMKWNHMRTIASIAASASLIVALRQLPAE